MHDNNIIPNEQPLIPVFEINYNLSGETITEIKDKQKDLIDKLLTKIASEMQNHPREQDILDAWQKNMDEWIFEGIKSCIFPKKEDVRCELQGFSGGEINS